MCLLLVGTLAAVPVRAAESGTQVYRRDFQRVFDALRGATCGGALPAAAEIIDTPQFSEVLSKSQRFGFLHALTRCARHFDEYDLTFRAADLWVDIAPKELMPQWLRLYYGAGSGYPAASLEAFEVLLQLAPDSMRALDLSIWHQLADAADQVDASGERKLTIYEQYRRIAKAPAAPHDDDYLRLAHARLLLARGRAGEARELLSNVTETHAIARMRVDRLFDALRADPAFEARLNLTAAAERDLADTRKRMDDEPRSIAAVHRHITRLLVLGRLDEALELADGTLAHHAADPKAFSDGDESRRWLLDRRAAVLIALGRYAEATGSLLEAANQLEHRRSNVSNLINLAGHLVREGRPAEGTRVLDGIREPSRYGQSWVEAHRSCAAVQLGNEAERIRSLEYLKAHEADNVSALSQALLCSNDLEGAAALMIRRLGSQRTSGDALLALQQRPGGGPESSGFRKLLSDRFESLRTREDVRAAAMAVGYIEILPVYLSTSY
jgi:hypothetical protein